jgi:hypothetical protein
MKKDAQQTAGDRTKFTRSEVANAHATGCCDNRMTVDAIASDQAASGA